MIYSKGSVVMRRWPCEAFGVMAAAAALGCHGRRTEPGYRLNTCSNYWMWLVPLWGLLQVCLGEVDCNGQ